MNRKGHIGLALLAAAPVQFLAGSILPQWGFLVAGAAVLADRIPDIDQRLPLVSHRGLTHTVLFGVITSLSLAAVLATGLTAIQTGPHASVSAMAGVTENRAVFTVSFVGFALGFASHLFGDMLIEAYDYALHPLWPFSDARFALGWISANSKAIWDVVFLAAGVLASLLAAVAILPSG